MRVWCAGVLVGWLEPWVPSLEGGGNPGETFSKDHLDQNCDCLPVSYEIKRDIGRA